MEVISAGKVQDSNPLIKMEDVSKRFKIGEHEVLALNRARLEIFPREFVALSGPSGSGKTTLLNLMGCIDEPNAGRIWFEGHEVASLSENQAADLRARKIGFIFQTFNLIPVLSALENVEYALLLSGASEAERRQRCEAALTRVGLERFMHHRPAQLSGGQRQRVAIARAVVKGPALLLADEATANLDTHTAENIMELLRDLNRNDGLTIVMTSHDPRILKYASRIVHITDGVLEGSAE